MGNCDVESLCGVVVGHLVTEKTSKNRRRILDADRFAISQPRGRDARCEIDLRIIVLIGLEKQHVAQQQDELRTGPAVWDISHVPPQKGICAKSVATG